MKIKAIEGNKLPKPCPICNGKAKLNFIESEYKYFCSNIGTHISCGDWKSTEKAATADWDRRVEEYKLGREKPKEIKGQITMEEVLKNV
ncbi:endogenous inhibitor of DNA gyrase (YacG/DUF329 family) [Clostridium acetobutylicum]|uniref:Uncharacterized protein n=1 Tax=Clostridium acetobutylicum (strain ATCC 824 / DSM 792 / JCM 1419 / IAM 19013 / LMG 5710 / NBRC 13948 / NRRL B-527 / VKM B-1787 / 2291 / W) TaxID=272562 RepID=Q97HT0_CLOAB|nr:MULTISPECIES: hypothetical protein [Clostridium]AAK79890.1 Hypothetical protein CA_C1928 [Clostridium acetobutylicum ATCC 824]ADZ20980.1 Conserved hypothetical protein [Clostridium acetobutylicum EA 2018]AEI32067.1 hypothetical protein SMB_G1957 [Clostridium acetobutylicum DSM 1731]AWV79678.1 hypothetical protein DK921_06105 [Clostridium acetobutylicum]MBC2394346.1 hypothetical protein [Clostridium acetobutylicum]